MSNPVEEDIWTVMPAMPNLVKKGEHVMMMHVLIHHLMILRHSKYNLYFIRWRCWVLEDEPVHKLRFNRWISPNVSTKRLRGLSTSR